jgi:hypothetical protein
MNFGARAAEKPKRLKIVLFQAAFREKGQLSLVSKIAS